MKRDWIYPIIPKSLSNSSDLSSGRRLKSQRTDTGNNVIAKDLAVLGGKPFVIGVDRGLWASESYWGWFRLNIAAQFLNA